ncbi:unnamed protein product [Phyllotreta striolata]|uniref:Uncharacterized protein n=1 Tax=Phyllotreta striolata TaxID=444603 RepID=A0A9N9TU35_PHYSR|nr:unnamed protein product [Phyllotreta striolata]
MVNSKGCSMGRRDIRRARIRMEHSRGNNMERSMECNRDRRPVDSKAFSIQIISFGLNSK